MKIGDPDDKAREALFGRTQLSQGRAGARRKPAARRTDKAARSRAKAGAGRSCAR